MKCEKCHTHDATIHVVKKSGHDVSKHFLCEACAEEMGWKHEGFKFTFENLLAALADFDLVPSAVHDDMELRCSCGHTFGKFREMGRLGCAACYQTFRSQMESLLTKIHGVTRHRGKYPRRTEPVVARHRELEQLDVRLQEAIRSEEYEEAARVRDQIKALKMDGGGGAGADD